MPIEEKHLMKNLEPYGCQNRTMMSKEISMKMTKHDGVRSAEESDWKGVVHHMANLIAGGQTILGFPYDDEIVGPDGIEATLYLPDLNFRADCFRFLTDERDVVSTKVSLVRLDWIAEAYRQANEQPTIMVLYDCRKAPLGHGTMQRTRVSMTLFHGPYSVVEENADHATYREAATNQRTLVSTVSRHIKNLEFWWPDAQLVYLGLPPKVQKHLEVMLYGDSQET